VLNRVDVHEQGVLGQRTPQPVLVPAVGARHMDPEEVRQTCARDQGEPDQEEGEGRPGRPDGVRPQHESGLDGEEPEVAPHR
jgi:hypothetical protein